MDLVDCFLWKASLLRQAIMILLHPGMNDSLPPKKAQGMVGESRLGLQLVWLPADFVGAR